MANLLDVSRDVVSRTAEGRAALIALLAVRTWKSSPAVRAAHGDLATFHDILTELHEAGRIKFRGEDFMPGTKKDGAELGLALHKRWTEDPALREKHGSFKAFVESERKAEDEGIRERTKAAGSAK